jgi:DNA-binding transcriptional LysR family regulator
MPSLEWDDLHFAMTLAHQRTPALTAAALKVRHSTVLRKLSAIEARLGVALFVRLREGYVPTAEGEILVESAKQMSPAIADVERRILGRDTQLTGSLRVTTAFIVMQYLLPPAIAAFSRAHPGIEVEVTEAAELVDLSKRQADIALRLSAQVPPHLVGRQLGIVRFKAYALKSIAMKTALPTLPQRITPLPKLIASAPWIAFERDRTSRFYDRWMRANLQPANIAARVDTFNSIAALIRTGLGIGLLPTFVETQEPSLRAVSAVIPELDTPLWLLTHADLRHTARVQAFMRDVGQRLKERLDKS